MKFAQPLARILSARNWPIAANALLFALAGALWLGTFALEEKTKALEQQLASISVAQSPRDLSDVQANIAATLPDHASYTQDLAVFFKIANASGVELGAIDYRVEENPKLPFLLNRSIEFRLNDEYPKAKAFLSRVLQKLPNASLQEIRIEKKDVLTAQGAIQIRLVLLYRVTPPNPGGVSGK